MRNFFKHLLTVWLPNLILVTAAVLLVRLGLSPLAFGLVLASKWQVFRSHRHGRSTSYFGQIKLWARSLRDNLCDLTVGFSFVVLLILTIGDLPIELGLAALYYIWLIVVKPLNNHAGIALQSAICQFIGLTILFLLGRQLPLLAVIGGAWLVSVISADHLLTAYQEKAHWLLTFSWGLLVAQLSWLFYQWLVVYSFFNARILIPQAPLVAGLVSYIFGSMYLDHMQTKLGKRRLFEYVVVIFALLIVLIIGTRWDIKL